MDTIKSPALLYGAITVAVLASLLSIYFLIPDINHVLIPAYAAPTKVHYKYVAVFGGIAVLGIIGVLWSVFQRLAQRKR